MVMIRYTIHELKFQEGVLVIEDQTAAVNVCHSDGDVFVLDVLREMPRRREVMTFAEQMLDGDHLALGPKVNQSCWPQRTNLEEVVPFFVVHRGQDIKTRD
ncbi:hypothetical protein GCM10008949_23870 [Deinococcus humi]|nr:hypothetical protein GCM10008949_23870 [Deinococcus humi]